MISIQLTNEEAELFKRFRQWQDKFSILSDRGVFEVKSGVAILYFNHQGTLMRVSKTEDSYVRKSAEKLMNISKNEL